ncbi:MAG: hypothetical protein PHF84_12670 [bacterium]|nr:hypothetical protein [bacterium]
MFLGAPLGAKEFRTVYDLYLQRSDGIGVSGETALIIQGQVVFTINQINYYRFVRDKDLSDARITLKIGNYVNETNFNLTVSIASKINSGLEYPVRSPRDRKDVTDRFITDFKLLFPLRGIVLEKQGLQANVNLGKNYYTAKGDLFFLVRDGFLKGVGILDQVFNRYSRMIITSYNSAIQTNDMLIPFTCELNYLYRLKQDVTPAAPFKQEKELKGLSGRDFKISVSPGNYVFIADEKEAGIFENQNSRYEKIEDRNLNEVRKSLFPLY